MGGHPLLNRRRRWHRAARPPTPERYEGALERREARRNAAEGFAAASDAIAAAGAADARLQHGDAERDQREFDLRGEPTDADGREDDPETRRGGVGCSVREARAKMTRPHGREPSRARDAPKPPVVLAYLLSSPTPGRGAYGGEAGAAFRLMKSRSTFSKS